MIVIDLEQGSDEWTKEKLGLPSSSNFSKILSATGKVSTQRKGYLYQLVAERITGHAEEGYKNGFMQEGNDREPESRAMYEIETGVEVETVGVVYKDEKKRFLCSPDGFCNKRSFGLEMKNVIGKTQVGYLLKNQLPTDYFPQVQGSLYVTGLDRWDFFTYSPGMPSLHLKIERDESYIKKLDEELNKFCDELEEITEKLKG